MTRWIFLGSDAIALPALDRLAARPDASLIGVFTQPDRPAGRGQRVEAGPVKTWARARGLPVHQPDRLDPSHVDLLRSLQVDLALVMAYGHLLRPAFLEAPRLGTFNLHTSLLPAYRGASPIATALACGEPVTGVTLMRIEPALDAGPIVDAESVPVHPEDTADTCASALALACIPLLERNWPLLAAGSAPHRRQDDTAATYCRRLVKEDGDLDFTAPAAALAARINGLFPWPGTRIPWGDGHLRIGGAAATPAPATTASPGSVLGTDPHGVHVATGSGTLLLTRLQRPGGRMLPAAEFIRGCPLPPGTTFPSRPMSPLVSRTPFPRR